MIPCKFCKRHKHHLQLQLNTHKIGFQVVQFFKSIALDFTGPPEKLFVCIPICKNAEIFKLLFFFQRFVFWVQENEESFEIFEKKIYFPKWKEENYIRSSITYVKYKLCYITYKVDYGVIIFFKFYTKKKCCINYHVVPGTLPHPLHLVLVWPVLLAQVWTHYKIGKLNMWTLFCNVCIDFLNSQIWKKIILELNGKPLSSRSQLIFPSKTWFLGIYLNFQWQKSL